MTNTEVNSHEAVRETAISSFVQHGTQPDLLDNAEAERAFVHRPQVHDALGSTQAGLPLPKQAFCTQNFAEADSC